jgi:hypothetical protein
VAARAANFLQNPQTVKSDTLLLRKSAGFR